MVLFIIINVYTKICTHPRLVVNYQHFMTPYQSHFQGATGPLTTEDKADRSSQNISNELLICDTQPPTTVKISFMSRYKPEITMFTRILFLVLVMHRLKVKYGLFFLDP